MLAMSSRKVYFNLYSAMSGINRLAYLAFGIPKCSTSPIPCPLNPIIVNLLTSLPEFLFSLQPVGIPCLSLYISEMALQKNMRIQYRSKVINQSQFNVRFLSIHTKLKWITETQFSLNYKQTDLRRSKINLFRGFQDF